MRAGDVEGEVSGRKFRPDVEGLRAIAILLVVLYHVRVAVFSGGYVGVDVFFVISGFLITGQLVRELRGERRVSLFGFYARRARRILPAATLVIISTAVASCILLPPLTARRVLGDSLAASFFGINFRLAAQGADYFTQSLPASPLQHFWSLSVEEQFYVVWPLLLLAASLVWLRRRTPTRGAARRAPSMRLVAAVLGAIAVGSLVASVLQTPNSPSWAYFSILTRGWELAAGALAGLAVPLAARLDRRVATALTWVGLAAIVAAATMLGPTSPYPGFLALIPVLGAVAVVLGGSRPEPLRGGAERLLGTPPFQRMGAWSYSWYLWHWPALVLVPVALGHPFGAHLSVATGLLVSAASLVVAVASYTLVEQPIRRMQLVVRRPMLGIAGGGSLALCSILAVNLAGPMLPSLTGPGHAVRLVAVQSHQLTASQLQQDLAQGVQTKLVPSNLTPSLKNAPTDLPLIVKNGCHLQASGLKSKPCIYGDTTSHTSVVLFGDSHAAQWFPALNTIAKQQHWRLVDITKAGCPPAEVNIVKSSGPYPQCTTWRDNSMAQIKAMHPAMVIAEAARYLEVPEAKSVADGAPKTQSSIWLDGVNAIFKFLVKNSSHVLFVSDTPTLASPAPDCVSAHLKDVPVCTRATKDAVERPGVKAAELKLATADHVASIDPTLWFCTPDRCPVITGNLFMYRDQAHMTPEWSNFIEPVVSTAVVRVMSR